MNLDETLRIAVAAAYRGGRELTQRFGHLTDIRKKGANDLVTDADLASEKAIIDTLKAAFPDHGILAEESGLAETSTNTRWIIDPLDGTTNFAHGISQVAVSIALVQDQDVQVGVVLAPLLGELFTAVTGRGAWLNQRPIQVSETAALGDSLMATGFPYEIADMDTAVNHRLRRCLSATQGVRRFGAAALDICHVACGRYEGFWEEGLKPWDTAAGILIAAEAGGRITTVRGTSFDLTAPDILVTNGRVHDALIKLMTLSAPELEDE